MNLDLIVVGVALSICICLLAWHVDRLNDRVTKLEAIAKAEGHNA